MANVEKLLNLFSLEFILTYFIGFRNAKPQARIIGGERTDIGKVPYQLQLLKNRQQICGATLISSNKALSAAHCFGKSIRIPVLSHLVDLLQKLSYKYEIIAGQTERYTENSLKTKPIGVTYYVHPDFCDDNCDDNTKLKNDIAVLILEKSLQFSDKIQPAMLPQLFEPTPVGENAIVSGWGLTTLSLFSAPPKYLQSVNVEIISNDECSAKYSRVQITITENMICAGTKPFQDSCLGDSGGPLVVNNILYGIVSNGNGCGDIDFPGVYTNVASYIDYIEVGYNAHNWIEIK